MASVAIFSILGPLALLLVPAQQRSIFTFNSSQASAWPVQHYAQAPIIIGSKRPQGMGGEQVSVIGNFGGTFSISGIGSTSSSRSDELINITTNLPLTFLAANFTILYVGGAQANTAGSITYEMQLYAGTAASVGAPLTGAVGGTDNMFNNSGFSLSAGAIPANGQVVLRLSRTLNLTQYAEGANTYTASGIINLTIN
ncbi:MAG TPA: hypothetical protein VGL56_06985 [Fimbriimonadaceae bacterium]